MDNVLFLKKKKMIKHYNFVHKRFIQTVLHVAVNNTVHKLKAKI